MSYVVEGYLRELPPEAKTSLGSVKKLELNITDPVQIEKLERIFQTYIANHPVWIAPRRHGGRDAYGVFLKLNTTGLVVKTDAASLRLPLEQWLNRPAKVSFRIKPYRFINQQGVVLVGGTAQLVTFSLLPN